MFYLSRSLYAILIYSLAFFVGTIIMGFEMLASRYLYPYFGGSITTWGALIATVLLALMLGYFLGGMLADKKPSSMVIGVLFILSAVYIALIPLLASQIYTQIFNHIGDGGLGVITASCVLTLPPLMILAAFTPFSLRLLLRNHLNSGSLSGRIYGISTFGSIFGTLGTTFILVPNFGSKTITFVFAVSIFICALLLVFFAEEDTLG